MSIVYKMQKKAPIIKKMKLNEKSIKFLSVGILMYRTKYSGKFKIITRYKPIKYWSVYNTLMAV